MRFHFLTCLLFSYFVTVTAIAEDIPLFYLGGQSNMDGYGRTNELPNELNGEVEGVFIFHGNTSKDAQPVDGRGVWAKLQPGHGVQFKSDGKQNKLSDRFGVELTFARTVKSAMPGKKIAIIKYSRGGTSIDEAAAGGFGCWEPDFEQGRGAAKGVNQYDHFLATVNNAMATPDIDGDGKADRLVPAGIVWMQGESDAAHGKDIADRYEANLKRLMDLIRAAFRTDDLPVVIGRISDSGRDDKDGIVWDHGKLVRAAQSAFVNDDVSAALVTSTDEYGYSDPWHYDSAGYIDLGKRFGEAMLKLHDKR